MIQFPGLKNASLSIVIVVVILAVIPVHAVVEGAVVLTILAVTFFHRLAVARTIGRTAHACFLRNPLAPARADVVFHGLIIPFLRLPTPACSPR